MDATITSTHENSGINKNIDFTYTSGLGDNAKTIPGNINYSRTDDIANKTSNHVIVASITPDGKKPVGFTATSNYLFNVSFDLPEYVSKNKFDLNKAKGEDVTAKMQEINNGFQSIIYNYILTGTADKKN